MCNPVLTQAHIMLTVCLRPCDVLKCDLLWWLLEYVYVPSNRGKSYLSSCRQRDFKSYLFLSFVFSKMNLPSFWTKPEVPWECHRALKEILSWPVRYLLPARPLCGEKIKWRSLRTKDVPSSPKGLKESSSSRVPRKVTKGITPVRQQQTKPHSRSR